MKKTKSTKQNIISGALSLTISGIIVKFLGLIYKVPLSYILTDEGMGYFNSAYAVYTFFYIICTAGVPKAISILTADAEGEGDHDLMDSIYKTAFIMFFILGTVVTLAFLFVSGPISKLIGNSGSYLTMLAIAPSILFVCASGVIRGYFNGRLDFIPIAVSEVISGGAKLILGLIFAIISTRAGHSLELVSAFTILGITVGSFLGFIYLSIHEKRQYTIVSSRQKRNYFSTKQAKKIISIALPLTLTSAIGNLGNIIDLTLIMNRLKNIGYSELQAGILYGNYTTLAVPMLNLLASFIAPLSAVLLPLISKSDVRNNRELLSQNVSVAMKIICFISIPVSIIFLIKPYELLSLIFEDSSAIISAPLLQILAPGIIFMAMSTVLNTTLEGIGRTTVPLISLIIASCIKLLVNYIMIGNDSLGILGASFGTSISYFFCFIISIFYISTKEKIQLKISKDIIKIFFASVFALGIMLIFNQLSSKNNLIENILAFIIFALVYIISLALMGFKELKRIINSAKSTKYAN
jgi:stage V sporulation protein B